ncbi:hypothetical protein [Micromonospora carbonacea]|uniref:ApbE family n=1 Tax=Micromonospora carbonacea TaxID=47853 RepID=A0A1C4XHA3_9ACTN|nr:hypothetical protein [Micromonospora carbonacea]SCF07845.1 ApbE family [Micromonospora carbonacea]
MLPRGGVGFDPSGLVKGWAVARAARRLTDLPDHDVCLNAGGAALDGYAALLVTADGRVRATPGWPGTRPAAWAAAA